MGFLRGQQCWVGLSQITAVRLSRYRQSSGKRTEEQPPTSLSVSEGKQLRLTQCYAMGTDCVRDLNSARSHPFEQLLGDNLIRVILCLGTVQDCNSDLHVWF